MNNQKFELTSTRIEHMGRVLYQIKALRDIEAFDLKAGDLGGYLEKADNLSQDGDAWVSGDAWVFGNARVYGDARVSGDALVCEKYDLMTISNLGSRNDTTSFFRIKQGGIYVRCGCFSGTIDEFEDRVQRVHGDNEHGRAYAAAITFVRAVVNAEAEEATTHETP